MSEQSKKSLEKGSFLFSDGAITVEFVMEMDDCSNQGERVLLARRMTPLGAAGDVLLKCVNLPLGTRPELRRVRRMLEEEVKLSRYMRHNAIAQVYGIHEVEGIQYVLAEFVDGNSLKTLLCALPERIVRFSTHFILYMGSQVAAALAHAHTRRDDLGQPLGIVHRAVDMERIWVSWSGHVKLTDFGLAMSKRAGRIASTVWRPRGHTYYASPEALLGQKVDGRSDLFQLGLLLLELATGDHFLDPLRGLPKGALKLLTPREREKVRRAIEGARYAGLSESVEDIIVRAATYTAEELAEATKSVHESLRGLLFRLLQRNPADRYQTADEVEAELRTGLDRLGGYGPQQAAAETSAVLTQAAELLADLDRNQERLRALARATPVVTTH